MPAEREAPLYQELECCEWILLEKLDTLPFQSHSRSLSGDSLGHPDASARADVSAFCLAPPVDRLADEPPAETDLSGSCCRLMRGPVTSGGADCRLVPSPPPRVGRPMWRLRRANCHRRQREMSQYFPLGAQLSSNLCRLRGCWRNCSAGADQTATVSLLALIRAR